MLLRLQCKFVLRERSSIDGVFLITSEVVSISKKSVTKYDIGFPPEGASPFRAFYGMGRYVKQGGIVESCSCMTA